jgi:polar amino acid transport system substrate-binding protein
MRNIPLVLSLFALSLQALANTADSPSEHTAADSKTLHIVTDTWPPYVIEDEEAPGIDVEVTQAVFRRLNIDLNLEYVPWKRAIEMMKNNRADALLAVGYNAEREGFLLYPREAMSTSESTLFCKACDQRVNPIEDALEGTKIAFNRGYQYAGDLDTSNKIVQVRADSFEQGFRMLSSGRVQYYAVNRLVGKYTLMQMGIRDIYPIEKNLSPPNPIYLAFAKARQFESLAESFSEILKRYKQTTEYQTIVNRYFSN